MGRIRSVKPEFNSNEGLSSLSAQAHLLAEALLGYADDEGFFNANPVLVRAGTCPLRKDFKNISNLLKELISINYLRLGVYKGRRYGQILHFTNHQKISHPSMSKISHLLILWDGESASSGNAPENAGEAPENSGTSQENSGAAPEGLRPDQGTGNREQGTGEANSGKAPESADPPENFFNSRTEWKARGIQRPVNEPVPLSDEAHMIAAAVCEQIGVTTPWAREQIALQADQVLKKFPEDQDNILATMVNAWKDYGLCAASGKLVKASCGPEKFFGEGRWRSPKHWGLKPGVQVYPSPP